MFLSAVTLTQLTPTADVLGGSRSVEVTDFLRVINFCEQVDQVDQLWQRDRITHAAVQ